MICSCVLVFFFFFKQKTAYEMRISDWSSDVCSSDLHAIVVAGDPALFNQYGVILVNPQRHPHVKAADGQAFIDWLLSAEGQAAIAGFKIDGKSLFFPNAAK